MYSGKTYRDKAHDVAAVMLPKVMEEMGMPCVIADENGDSKINVEAIVRIYKQMSQDIYDEM